MTDEAKSTTEVQEEDDSEVSVEEPSLAVEDKELFDRMMEAGVFYGRSKSKTNPLTRKYIVTTRSGFEVIDLRKAIESLKSAGEILKNVFSNNGVVLFVGTSPAAKSIVKEMAGRLESPYVSERWLGGTLTNFNTITKRITHFKKLKEDKAKGRLEKYTKKEQLDLDKEMVGLEKFFGGIESLDKLPSMVFIADISANEYAAKEAKLRKIPVMGLLNTDTNPNLIDHAIPCNDRNMASVKLIMEYLTEASLEGKKQATLKVGEVESKGEETGDKRQAKSK